MVLIELAVNNGAEEDAVSGTPFAEENVRIILVRLEDDALADGQLVYLVQKAFEELSVL